MTDSENLKCDSRVTGGAAGPLVLPWRAAANTVDGAYITALEAPLRVKGARATLSLPGGCAHLVIDGFSVICTCQGTYHSLRTEDLIGAKVRIHSLHWTVYSADTHLDCYCHVLPGKLFVTCTAAADSAV
jgi:hypothetical protein